MRRRTVSPISLVLAAVAAVGALAGACGGGQKVNPAADRAAGERAALKPSDFPAGWKSKPHEKLPLEDELAAEIPRCLGISPPSSRASAVVRSPDFNAGFGGLSSVIVYARSKRQADTDAAAYTGPKYVDCAKPGYGRQMHETAPKGTSGNTVTDLDMAKLPFPAVGDRRAAYRLRGVVHVDTLTVPVNVDLVYVFKGRAEAELMFVAPGSTFPPGFEENLVRTVARRM